MRLGPERFDFDEKNSNADDLESVLVLKLSTCERDRPAYDVKVLFLVGIGRGWS